MIKLNDLFGFSEEEIKNTKLEFCINDGQKPSHQLIQDWLTQTQDKKENGDKEGFYFHNPAKPAKRHFSHNEEKALSFVRLPTDNDLWLFVSAGRIKTIDWDSYCDFDVIERLKPFFGRLIIRYHLVGQNRVRKAEQIFKKSLAAVEGILPSIYSGISISLP